MTPKLLSLELQPQELLVGEANGPSLSENWPQCVCCGDVPWLGAWHWCYFLWNWWRWHLVPLYKVLESRKGSWTLFSFSHVFFNHFQEDHRMITLMFIVQSMASFDATIKAVVRLQGFDLVKNILDTGWGCLVYYYNNTVGCLVYFHMENPNKLS